MLRHLVYLTAITPIICLKGNLRSTNFSLLTTITSSCLSHARPDGPLSMSQLDPHYNGDRVYRSPPVYQIFGAQQWLRILWRGSLLFSTNGRGAGVKNRLSNLTYNWNYHLRSDKMTRRAVDGLISPDKRKRKSKQCGCFLYGDSPNICSNSLPPCCMGQVRTGGVGLGFLIRVRSDNICWLALVNKSKGGTLVT